MAAGTPDSGAQTARKIWRRLRQAYRFGRGCTRSVFTTVLARDSRPDAIADMRDHAAGPAAAARAVPGMGKRPGPI